MGAKLSILKPLGRNVLQWGHSGHWQFVGGAPIHPFAFL